MCVDNNYLISAIALYYLMYSVSHFRVLNIHNPEYTKLPLLKRLTASLLHPMCELLGVVILALAPNKFIKKLIKQTDV